MSGPLLLNERSKAWGSWLLVTRPGSVRCVAYL